MIKELKQFWWEWLNLDGRIYMGAGALFLVSFFGGILLGGCGKVAPAKPEVLVLRPGQSAVVLENVSVLARIPAQGDTLYEGPVMIERGTVAIKPIIE